ncbi:MAG TPA: thiamine-phosphate kinase [Candidatus Hydrogenedentes bacterium]|nr:thiamine-phosphate kinase [Candidatus Hydrogenedentota bacterium]
METLRDIGEFGLINRVARMLPGNEAVVEGIGDDCAVLKIGGALALVSCDASIEDVHFKRCLSAPEDIGWKAMTSAISDIAAMGGHPRFALITLACPAGTETEFVDRLYHGFSTVATRFGVTIVGGDTAHSPSGIAVDIMVIGETVEGRYLLRSGAQQNDVLAVTGYPGRSAAGLLALERGLTACPLIPAHVFPVPRVEEGKWFAQQPSVHAMIDLSDGLVQDAGHIAERSGLGLDIDPERVPIAPELDAYQDTLGINPRDLALAGGEEYELILALDPKHSDDIRQAFQDRFFMPLTVVGHFMEASHGVCVAGEPVSPKGFDHFRK